LIGIRKSRGYDSNRPDRRRKRHRQGTGGQALHANSRRYDRRLSPINCGALPETLLDRNCSGISKARSRALQSDKRGLFQAADGGTVFLDEIGLTSSALQMRLLRVLQEREFRPVGTRRMSKWTSV